MGKSAQTSAECNKLIMISRRPGYGHLEYLVPGFSRESQHVTLKLILLGLIVILIGIENAVNHSQCLTTTMIVIKFYSFEVGKNWLYAKL